MNIISNAILDSKSLKIYEDMNLKSYRNLYIEIFMYSWLYFAKHCIHIYPIFLFRCLIIKKNKICEKESGDLSFIDKLDFWCGIENF